MPVYDYIIVGGGISGLFSAYQLAKTDKSILLVESTNRWGGRLFTQKRKNIQFEMGGARISSKHKKVMSLLQEFNLESTLLPLPDKISYHYSGPRIEFYSLLHDLVEGSKLYSKKYLQSVNLLQLCFDVLGKQMTTVLKTKLGYDSEFEQMNAHQALRAFKQDLFSKSDYFILQGGFSSLLDKLVQSLTESENVTLQLETQVTEIGKNFVTITKRKVFGNTIVCCVPKETLQQFHKFASITEVKDVTEIPLLRIYAKYPKDKSGKVWFHKLNRTITDNYIRHIIPIDPESGLIMISYTDGLYATMWSRIAKLGDKQLIKHLHKEINEVLKITPPKPEWITSYFWSAGVHMWKPGVIVDDAYERIIKPFPNENIYVINEAYSLHQCWVEGSLSMCYDVLQRLDRNFKHIGGKAKRRNMKRNNTQDTTKPKRTKLFTIKQVMKHKHWIVLDIKGQLRIYDVRLWLQDHPGGADNLKRGIEANKYYLDKDKYPESPIQLFKQIGRHATGKVIQNFLLKPNNKVSYVGKLKKT